MKPEDIVVRKDIALELQEAGFEQETIWYWRIDEFNNAFLRINPKLDSIENLQRIRGNNKFYSAPTASEIAEKLPGFIKWYKRDAFLAIEKMTAYGKYEVKYRNVDDHMTAIPYDDSINLANALAKMWLYLKKNNLL